MEKLLLVNVNDADRIRGLASGLGIKCSEIKSSVESSTLYQLFMDNKEVLGDNSIKSCLSENESLIVLCEVSDAHADEILDGLRQLEIEITFKAVMTPINRKWTVEQMVQEMRREKFELCRRLMMRKG